jgi:hypothetical protein
MKGGKINYFLEKIWKTMNHSNMKSIYKISFILLLISSTLIAQPKAKKYSLRMYREMELVNPEVKHYKNVVYDKFIQHGNYCIEPQTATKEFINQSLTKHIEVGDKYIQFGFAPDMQQSGLPYLMNFKVIKELDNGMSYICQHPLWPYQIEMVINDKQNQILLKRGYLPDYGLYRYILVFFMGKS